MKMKMSWKSSIFVVLAVFFLAGFSGIAEGDQKDQARPVMYYYTLPKPKYHNPRLSYPSTSRAALSYRSKSRSSMSRPSRSRPSLSVPSKSRPSLSDRSISKNWL